jgi:hypothetical protein
MVAGSEIHLSQLKGFSSPELRRSEEIRIWVTRGDAGTYSTAERKGDVDSTHSVEDPFSPTRSIGFVCPLLKYPENCGCE